MIRWTASREEIVAVVTKEPCFTIGAVNMQRVVSFTAADIGIRASREADGGAIVVVRERD